MNKRFFTAVFIMMSFLLFSQTRYYHQAIGGFVGGITGKNGFFAGAGYQKLLAKGNWGFRADLIYAHQKTKIKNDLPLDSTLPMEHLIIAPSAIYSFEDWGLLNDKLILSIFAGGLGGYERLNYGKQVLKKSEIHFEDKVHSFIYGVQGGIMGEYEITRSWVFAIDGRQAYRFNSNAGELTFYVGGGLRYYF